MTEYRENDADFEACFPVKRARAAEGIEVRELPRTRAVTLQHRGSYHSIAGGYAIVFRAIKERGHEVVIPTREVSAARNHLQGQPEQLRHGHFKCRSPAEAHAASRTQVWISHS